MSKRLANMRRNPKGDWRIADVEAVCAAFGVRCAKPSSGSHYKVSHPSQSEILTIPAKRPIKPTYIRKLAAFLDAVREADDAD